MSEETKKALAQWKEIMEQMERERAAELERAAWEKS